MPDTNHPNINYADFFPGLPPYTPSDQPVNQNAVPTHVTLPIANENSGQITGPANERPSSNFEGASQSRANNEPNQNPVHNIGGTSV